MMMITLIERERERNSQSNKCSKCSGYVSSLDGRCNTQGCENYWNKNSPSKFRKSGCKQCSKRDYLGEDGICFSCALTEFRLTIQQAIKEEGLKSVQIQWEQMKREIDSKFRQLLSYLEQNEPAMAKTFKQNKDEMLKTVEADLYPERNRGKGGSGWVWILVIGAVVIGGLVGFVWYKKKRKNNSF